MIPEGAGGSFGKKEGVRKPRHERAAKGGKRTIHM